jgi:HAD superfamily hydrolase (TIGR01509 family)
MTLKVLIFDFDGVVLDTETPEFRAWQSIYREHGHELPIENWIKIVGGAGTSRFDAVAHLAELTQGGANAALLRARHRSASDALILIQPILPGVINILDEARDRNLGLVIASSSSHAWVNSHLTRLGLFDRFDRIICAEDVPPGRTKPNPDLFLKALEVMRARADEAIVFEDSLNGVKAARAAGIFVVAVPNPVTSLLGVDGADLTLKSLADLQFSGLLSRFIVE